MSRALTFLALTTLFACSSETSTVAPAPEQVATDPAALYAEHCAFCHEGAVKKAPHSLMLGLLSPESIYATLSEGVMREQAAMLSDEERRSVAAHLSTTEFGAADAHNLPRCTEGQAIDASQPAPFSGWGLDHSNRRFIPAATAQLSQADAAQLEPSWAFKFPSANRARSQPLTAWGSVFVGSHGGQVYALDQESGCVHWSFSASGEVRTGLAMSAQPDAALLYFGDVLGYVYAVHADDGSLAWRRRADDHPNATITGSPTLHDGSLYVPVSALEVSLAADPTYQCCTFRGSVVAYDALSGEQRWKTYTIDEPAVVQKKNRAGTDMWGPSGAVIWNSPSIDPERGQLFVGTGENMSSPATDTSDAIFAMDLETGTVNWVFQATEQDAWNVACDTENDHSCPEEDGPDFDFGAATIFIDRDAGDLVLGGQKSGWVHALDAASGELVWQTQVGRGGIQGGVHFGMAADDKRVYVPISDMADGRSYDHPDRPGLHAVDLDSGEIVWSALAPTDVCGDRPSCHPGISQAITVAGELVLAGGMDGVLRIHDADSGQQVYELDATQAFAATDGAQATGGSFGGSAGPIVMGGRVLISSGYGIYDHMPGNLMLVLSPATTPAGSPPPAR